MNLSIHNELKLVCVCSEIWICFSNGEEGWGKGGNSFRSLFAVLPGVFFGVLGEFLTILQIFLC